MKKGKLDMPVVVDFLKAHLEVNAGRLAEVILKQGKDPRDDENCHKAFLMLGHLKEIEDYLYSGLSSSENLNQLQELFIPVPRSSYYFCMDCDWEGEYSECDFDTDYDEFKGVDRKYPICPDCGGGLDC